MNWKLKARIQGAISLLPPSASYAAYYALQRRFGSLRRINPLNRLAAGVSTWNRIERQDRSPSGKVFLEIGTGRVPLVPLAYWLMGAEETITLDLNPYVKAELIKDSLRFITDNQDRILALFGSSLVQNRFEELLKFSNNRRFSTFEFLDLCHVTYIAPGDAADTDLPDRSVDYHTSYTVFEHIPGEVLRRILEEGNRITKDDALFVHRIDYSDHFSHSDKQITAINFLQYDDDEWEKYAGNRYMYMNRMRHDDYLHLFNSAGHRIVAEQPDVDQGSQDRLKSGKLHLSTRFSAKSDETLAIIGAWLVTQKAF